MVVSRLLAEVETAEGQVGAAVGEVLHVGRSEAEHSQVPGGHAREIDGLQHEVPEPYDARGLDRRAHHAIDARPVLRGVGGRDHRLAHRQRLHLALSLQRTPGGSRLSGYDSGWRSTARGCLIRRLRLDTFTRLDVSEVRRGAMPSGQRNVAVRSEIGKRPS